jgi:glutathione S-transferase
MMMLLVRNPFSLPLCRRGFSSAGSQFKELTLYGHYVSQPARACAWLMKIEGIDYTFERKEPMRGDCKQPSYVAKFPTALSPGLEVTFEDETSFRLTEATAIMQYLCEKKQLEKWWPSSSSTSVSAEQRAQLASYLSAHHGTTRKISHLCFFKLMRFLMDPKKNVFDPENARDVTLEKATEFQRVWLKPFMAGVGTDEAYFNTDDAPATFIAGMSHPTIADLIAYVEIAQVQQMDIL